VIIDAMKNSTRLRIAVLSTLAFLGILTTAGIAIRSDQASAPAVKAASERSVPSVVRQTKVRTVHVRRKLARIGSGAVVSAGSGSSGPSPAASAVRSAPSTSPVSTRVSPTGAGDDEGENEDEHGEEAGEDDHGEHGESEDHGESEHEDEDD
jgi:hypothetical protein